MSQKAPTTRQSKDQNEPEDVKVVLTDIYNGCGIVVSAKCLEKLAQQQANMDPVTETALKLHKAKQEIEAGDSDAPHTAKDIKHETLHAIRDVIGYVTQHPRKTDKNHLGREAYFMLMHAAYALADSAYYNHVIEIKDLQDLADVGFKTLEKLLDNQKILSDQDPFYDRALRFKRGVEGKIQWVRPPEEVSADPQSHP
jgi:hypothetical protein